jgi:phosphoglycolate phosphatase
MKYKVAIFDFDGTLADTFPFMLSILDYLADKYHIERVNPEDISHLRKLPAKQLMEHFHFPMWKLPLIGRNVCKLMAKNIHQITLFDGIDAVIKDLAELGIILVVVSSNSYENVVKVLGMENTERFSHFECGSSIFGKKGRFKRVLKKFNVDPSEVISIGDEIRDLEASQNVQIPFGAVVWGFTDPEIFAHREPNHIFHSTGDITTLLAGS